MKTTARILWGLVAVALCTSATWTMAHPIWLAVDAEAATLTVFQANSTGPRALPDSRSQSDDLLARARRAMDEGQFDAAEKLVERAEALKVSYSPLNPLADTPAKVRHDLQRKRGAGSPASGLRGLLPPSPFGGRTQGTPVPADAFAQAPGAPAGMQGRLSLPNAAAGGQVTPYPTPGAAFPGANDADAGFATVESLPPTGSMIAAQGAQANGLLLEARRALAVGDVRRAAELIQRAKTQQITYGPNDDTPDLVLADVGKYQELMTHRQTHGQSEAFRRELARLMMQQAESLVKWKDYNEAERLALQARDQRVAFGPLETNPDMLLARIAAASRQQAAPYAAPGTGAAEAGVALPPPSAAAKNKVGQLLRRARAALAGGDLASAQTFAQAAMDMQVPETSFGPGEDRPGMALLDIQKAYRAGASGVVQAGATAVMPATGQYPPNQPASHAVYNPASDPTNTVPAAVQQPVSSEIPKPLMLGQLTPSPGAGQPMPGGVAGGNSAVGLFQQGEAALKARNVEEALRYYRQAAQNRDQLDPTTAQLLQDRLQMLSTPTNPAAPQGTLAESAMDRQQLLARQVSTDLAHQERRAAQLRETDPKTALTLLEQARGRVEAAGLEPNARAVLLRRVDRSIGELKQFIEDNQATISLAERNNQTRGQIDREKEYGLEVEQRLSELTTKFNQLCDEQRFDEAQVIAKEAYDLAPDSKIARQLLWNAKFILRNDMNQRINGDKEQGFIDTMFAVDRASTPVDPDTPYLFPPATDWKALTESRSRFKADTSRERTGHELEIERKLDMPVSVKFTNMPLAQVLDQLQRLADVNMYLDPQGMTEENLDPSTQMVNINLPHEISLRSALNLILEPLHLSYVIKDQVLKVTSAQYSNHEVYTVTYDVGDLVIPIPNFLPNSRMGLGGAYNDAMARNGFNTTYGQGPMGNFTSAEQPTNPMTGAPVLANVSRSMAGSSSGGLTAGAATPNGFGPGGLGGGTQADFEPLIDLITSTVEPESWTEMGGNGTIEPYENNLTLVIKTTEEIHAEIVDVLAQLRRLQDLQVTIEVRFITLNDDFFESIRVDFDFDIDDDIDRPFQTFGKILDNTGDDDDDDDTTGTTEPDRDVTDKDHGRSVTVGMSAPGVFSADLDIPFTQGSYSLAVPQFGGFDASAGASLGFAVLSDIEAFFFINAAQGDSRTNILQAPKVTLFNGQTAYVQDVSMSPFVMGLIPVVGDFAAAQQPVIVILQEGTFMTVQAVVSHDRRFVRLTVIPFFSQIGDVNTFTFSGRTTSTTDTSTEGNQDEPDDATKQNNIKRTTTEGTTVQLPTYSSISVSTTVSVPDGGTVLLGGIKRLSEGRNEYGTPILNKIPYLSRLFRNVGIGRETQSLMMTVTPRIIIQEEEEERIGAGPAGP